MSADLEGDVDDPIELGIDRMSTGNDHWFGVKTCMTHNQVQGRFVPPASHSHVSMSVVSE
jgi:hypothetical protein